MSLYKGRRLKICIFGASHADTIGVKISGFPSGESVDITLLHNYLSRRSPGRGELVSQRREADVPTFLSGIEDGFTSGGEICAVIHNTDVRREDYVNHIPRPGHADFTAWQKYGLSHDMSGGGEFSGRMTAPLCVAGGICLQYLERRGVSVSSRIVSIGGKTDGFEETIASARDDGDSVGGVIECRIEGAPVGLGGELFDGLEGSISALAFAVPAVKGVEFGAGFQSAGMRGSEHNDPFVLRDGAVVTEKNDNGGILGGISSGMPIVFRVAVKPTPSVAKPQRSVDLDTMQPVTVNIKGRHDPCIVPRALPVIEAVAAIAITDAMLCEEKSGELAAIRREIDDIDGEISALFIRRMAKCGEIAVYKKQHSLPTLDAKREAEKLDALRLIAGPELEDEIGALYREIFRISREYQDGKR